MKNNAKLKIAAIGDIHVDISSQGKYVPLFEELSQKADILLLCGDITDRGLPEEAHILVHDLASLTIPVVGVFGNHDFESGKTDEVKDIFRQSKLRILDGTYYVFRDVGFAGVKGFGGGFENHMLEPWGESTIKDFVHEAVNEALRLETALSKLETEKKVVLLHYTPIPETAEGEQKEIYPFLGSSRLMNPINLYSATAVFHGHTHYGKPKGQTSKGIPVYNVSLHMLRKINPEQPYIIVEV
jgi:Icc-related predicted phosphoesterase